MFARFTSRDGINGKRVRNKEGEVREKGDEREGGGRKREREKGKRERGEAGERERD